MSNDDDKSETSDKPELKNPEQIAKAIKSFINEDSEGNAAAATAQSAKGKQFHDRRDIIKALTNLQLTYKGEYTPGQQVNINTDDFKHALLNGMAKLNNSVITKSLSQIDGRTIDFVEMLFGAFLRDKNISDAMKNLLLQLQIPLIKIALLDNQFFHNNKHPARNVLDTIAHLGIGIEDRDNTLYKTIELIIEQLLTTFDQNMTSFNTSLIALSRLLKIEKNKHEEKEAETHKQILKEHARQIILTELKHQTKGLSLPKEVKPLIVKHWSNLMLNIYLRHGKDSDEWDASTDVLHQLIASFQPVKSKIEFLLLKNSSRKLIERIKNDLYKTKQDKKSIDASIKFLTTLHKKILSDELTNKSPGKEIRKETEVYDAKEKELSDKKLKQSKEDLGKLPTDVKLGIWFEVYNGEYNAMRRAKLSIILFDEATLVFVDRKGHKVIEKSSTDFLKELENNQSRILEDQPIFHNALIQVITGLISNKK
jgi:hypothetical protein